MFRKKNERGEVEQYDSEWTFPYTDNYTGPNWSDGKWQASVAYGKTKPKSLLDAYSRDHDTAYALCRDTKCLDDADKLYFDSTRSMSFTPRLIGSLPYYFNSPLRRAYEVFYGENLAKMSQAVVYNPIFRGSASTEKPGRGNTSFKTGAVTPVLRVGKTYDPESDATLGTVDVCYSPDLPTVNENESVSRATPIPSSRAKEVPLALPEHGGNDRGIRRSNFFVDHRGDPRNSFIYRWRRRNMFAINKNKNKIYIS